MKGCSWSASECAIKFIFNYNGNYFLSTVPTQKRIETSEQEVIGRVEVYIVSVHEEEKMLYMLDGNWLVAFSQKAP